MRWLITGAAQGIGAALATARVRAGDEVVGVDVDRAAASALTQALGGRNASSEGSLVWCFGDLAERDQVDGLVEEAAAAGPFDVIAHVAGISCVGPFADSDMDAQRRVLRVNLEAPLVLTSGWLKAGALAPTGTVVFVSSLSHFVGYPGASVYAATKDGLAHYARSLDADLSVRGQRALCVFPGPVRTEHAARYAPPRSGGAADDASKRMPPAAVARAIERAVAKRSRVVLPGFGTKVFARLGRWLPGLTEPALRRVLCDPWRDETRGSSPRTSDARTEP